MNILDPPGKHTVVPRSQEAAPPRRTLQQVHAQGPMVVLGEGASSYERGTPVPCSTQPRERLLSTMPLL